MFLTGNVFVVIHLVIIIVLFQAFLYVSMLQIMFKNFKNDFVSLLCIVNSVYQIIHEF